MICIAASAYAEEKGMTRSEYINQQMKWAKNDPKWNPTAESLGTWFDKMDADGDGLLTAEERDEGSKKAKEDKKAKETKAAPKGDGMTRSEWVKQRMEWARKDPKWNPSKEKLEAKFDELDKNGDGKLTPDEQE
jgi:hypothetical protein